MRQRIAMKMALAMAAALVAAILTAAPAAPAVLSGPRQVDSADDSTAYLERVDRAAAIARRDVALSRDPDYQVRVDRDLAGIAAMLPARERIVLDGRQVRIDNRRLHGAVSAALAVDSGPSRPKLVADIAKRLETIAASTEAPGAPGGSRQVLRAVMSESVSSKPDAVTQLTARIATWLRRTLGGRFNISPSINTGSIPRPPQWLLMTAALIIIALTSALMLRLIFRRVRVVSVDESALEVAPLNDLPEADPYEQALALAREGSRREAVRMLFKSLQFRLDAMRVVRYRRAQTNYEYLDSVRGAGRGLEPPVRTMIATFERALYGLRDVDTGEFGRYEDDYKATMDEAEKLSSEEQ